jgi:hypothetical protein
MQTQLPSPESAPERQRWTTAVVQDLPRLTELTLQTGPAIPGDCGVGGSGGTCF